MTNQPETRNKFKLETKQYMNTLDIWEVFIQTKPGLSHKHAGTVQAATAELALQNARDVYTRRMEGTSIWVIPAKYVVTSEGMDKEAFFDPADDKLYRHPTFYQIPNDVKNM